MVRTIARFIKRITLLAAVTLLVVGYLATGLDARVPRPNDEPTQPQAVAPVIAATEGKAAEVQSVAAAVRRFDDAMAGIWTEAAIEVAPEADAMTVSRRLSLALVGSGLPLEEIRTLQSLPETERVAYQLEHLLRDPRHHDYWAERWTRAFVGADNGPFITYRRRRFRLWLSDAIAANRPVDQLVRDLITANGLATDRPEVNFLTVTMDSGEPGQPDPVRLAARTARVFLGLRIDCLQCHNDFLGNVSLGERDDLRSGTQADFHSLAAFYSPARFNGLQGIRDANHPYQYQYLNATDETEVEPIVPFAKSLLPTEGDDRQRLAIWLTHPENHQFAYAVVHRVWALMFGRPIGAAVDDLRLDEQPHPAIKVLADELIRSAYDLRHVIRVITGSKAFRLASEADFEITPRHEALASVFPLVRLRPEQVAASVIQAARVKTVDRESSLLVQLQKFGGINDFVTRYGDIGEDEFDQESVTITQRLLLLNGELVREYGKSDPLLNATAHINRFARSGEEAITVVYLCVLNREPDADELALYRERLEPDPEQNKRPVSGLRNPLATDHRERLIEDLFWVLVNSSEFSWNH